MQKIKMTKLSVIFYFSIFCCSNLLLGQNYGDFKEDSFPLNLIDESIIENRKLESKIKMLNGECNWTARIGKKIDVIWFSTDEGNLFGHVYEYFMDCDNLRLIYWHTDPNGKGKIVDFMIEDLEDDSQFVSSKKKYLKNKKKYQIYLKSE